MTAPTWFIVLVVVFMVLYVFGKFLGTTFTEILGVLFKGGSGIGCLLKTIIGLIAIILVFWYIITEL